jgi:hypothetical protein
MKLTPKQSSQLAILSFGDEYPECHCTSTKNHGYCVLKRFIRIKTAQLSLGSIKNLLANSECTCEHVHCSPRITLKGGALLSAKELLKDD